MSDIRDYLISQFDLLKSAHIQQRLKWQNHRNYFFGQRPSLNFNLNWIKWDGKNIVLRNLCEAFV